MRCAVKAAGSAAIILRSIAVEEAKILNAARDKPPAASFTHPAAVTAVASRGTSLRDIEDYELELMYSGESDDDTDSKTTAAKTEPDVAKPELTKSGS